MSHLPGEMTKQSLSAPPANIRSTRYSLTARGRSVPSSNRLPTGSNSFEKASGWMRVPLPAAGMIPHMVSALHAFDLASNRAVGARLFEQCDQFSGAPLGGMLEQNPLPSGLAHVGKLTVAQVERRQDIAGSADDNDLAPGIEEFFEPIPPVAQHGRAARRRLEQPPR